MPKFDKQLYAEIGKQLKEARLNKGMSLQDVSDAIGGSKTKQTIMRYENGTTRIEAELMKKLCALFGLDPNEVIQKATYQQAMKSYINVQYTSKSDFIKIKQITNLKNATAQHDILTAYEKADSKTQRAVRIMLGLE